MGCTMGVAYLWIDELAFLQPNVGGDVVVPHVVLVPGGGERVC